MTSYAVAATGRLLKIVSLFCKRDPSKRQYSAKETYDFKEPTNCSHPTHLDGIKHDLFENIVSFIGLFCRRDL